MSPRSPRSPTGRPRRELGRALAVLVLGVVAGCTAPPDGVTVRRYDPETPARGPLVFDLGVPSGRHRLAIGWGPEQVDGGVSWVRPAAAEAHLSLMLPALPWQTLAVGAWPLGDGRRPVTTMTVAVNDVALAPVRLAAGPRAYRWAVPPRVLRPGRNLVAFRFGPAVAGAGDHDGDRPRVSPALALDYLELQPRVGAAAAEPPRPGRFFAPQAGLAAVALDGRYRDAVAIGGGSPHRHALVVPAGAWLELAFGRRRAALDGGPWWTFRLDLKAGEAAARTLFTATLAPDGAKGWQRAQADLAAFAGQRVTLRFHAEATAESGDEVEAGGVGYWAEPRLLRSPIGEPPPNVVLVSIDTLRADHLGCYGYHRDTSPSIDALAGSGVRFARAISQAPWTTPSHMSMLTGRYPSSHGVNQDFARLRAGGRYRSLSPAVPTLAELLRPFGYRTFALAAGGSVAAALGFGRGFEVYQEQRHPTQPDGWRAVVAALERYRRQPFFFFLHTFEVHAPYHRVYFARDLLAADDRAAVRALAGRGGKRPIAALQRLLETRGLFRPEVTAALYDGGIKAADAMVGWLIEELRRLDLERRTLVIVTSDHGEEFAEHRPDRFYDAHCSTQFDELLHVPLIMRLPGVTVPAAVVEQTVELVDIVPTVLDLVGIAPPPGIEGRSLLPALAGKSLAPKPWALSEATCEGPEIKAWRSGELKYLAAFVPHQGERGGVPGTLLWERLFDLRADPGEQRSLHGAVPRRLRALRRQLADHLDALAANRAESEHTELDSALIDELRALGYVE